MPLATQSDVEARLGRSIPSADKQLVDGLLEEAEALAIGFLGGDPTASGNPPAVPVPVKVAVSRMVARVLERDTRATGGVESFAQADGPFSTTVRFGAGTTAGGPWLAATDKAMLRPYRIDSGLTSLAVTSGRTGRYRSLDAAGYPTVTEDR